MPKGTKEEREGSHVPRGKNEWERPRPSGRAASGTQLQPSGTWDVPIFQELFDTWVFI